MDWITDKKFLVGLAVGFVILPRVAKIVQAKLSPAPAVAG